VTYGNGQNVENEYDDFSRITGVRFNGKTTPRYKYTYVALCQRFPKGGKTAC